MTIEASKSAYLHRMGIDIYVPRTVPGDRSDVVVLEEAASEPAEPAEETEAGIRFYFCFLDYGDLGICCELAPSLTGLPVEARRFCSDVAFSVLGQRIDARIVDLHWPLVDNGTASQSSSAARNILMMNLSKLPARILCFGSRFAELVADVEDVVSGSSFDLSDHRLTVVESVSAHLNNPDQKRSLWKSLLGEGFDGIGRTGT